MTEDGTAAVASDDGFEAVSGSGRIELDGTSLLLRLSPGAAALHGVAAAPLELAALLGRLHPADRPDAAAAFAAALRGAGPLRCEYRLSGDAPRWIELRGGLAGEAGQAARLQALALDITPRRLAEEQARLALREVEHRAKNALSAAQAVVRLTRAEDPRDFARSVEQRLVVLGLAHARLSAAPPGSGFALRSLVDDTFAPYDATALVAWGPEVMLCAQAVQPVSMALHELVTNAAKYGALSRPSGEVLLHWRLRAKGMANGTKHGANGRGEGRGEGGGLTLAWRERGGPAIPSAPTRRGFGMRMVQAVIRDQLRGRLRVSWHPDGLRLAIALPDGCLLPPPVQPGANGTRDVRGGDGRSGDGRTGDGSTPTAGRAKR